MALPKVSLSAKTTPIEGATGAYLITLDTAAPAGGLTVYYNTSGSTATFNSDYNFTAGANLSSVTANSFTIAAGATAATLNLVAYTDTITDANETVVVNLTMGTGYDLTGANTQFAPHTDFAVGTTPQCVTAADFNGDGNADLATANWDSNNVSVLLNNGNGGFAAKTNFVVGTNPQSIATADFNNDGNADLVAANVNNNNISILLGNGLGGFAAKTNYAMGSWARSIAVADFNNDGKADLATANSGSDNVSVRLGNGNGSFAAKTSFAVGTNPWAVTAADFNGDGKIDLAAANYDDNNVSVLLGNGNGGFAGKTNFAVGTGPISVTAADFNSDGKTDLAAANYDSNNVSVLLGNGVGGFADADFAVDGGPRSVTATDVNSDGKADLVTANYDSNNVSVLLGNGNGGFVADATLVVGSAPKSVTAADFNGDGKGDLATANRDSSNISMLLNTSTSTSAALTITDVFAANPNHQQFVTQPFISIPDPGTITSTLNVNGMSGSITDLNVSVNIKHSWDTDLDVYLITPTGKQIELFTDVGEFADDNFTNTILDNEASTPIENGSAPFTGSYRPEGNLASSYGMNPNGVWKLKVTDDGVGIAGKLNSWSLDVSTSVSNHAPTGTATFTLANGIEDTAYTIKESALLQGFSDIDGDNLSVANLTADNGELTVINGGWTFTPNANYSGEVALSYNVTDGKGGSIAATQSFTLTGHSSSAGVNIIGNDFITDETGDTAVFNVNLNAAPTHDVSITFTSSLISEGAVIKPTLTFTPANWATAQTLTIKGQNDYNDDSDVNYHVSAVISTIDVDYKFLTIPPINLTNSDDHRDPSLTLSGDKNGVPTIDHLTGLDGNDKLYGLLLPDELKGGIGNDKLYGGYDDDNLFGEDGDDYLFGEQDNDYLDGGAGNDFLYGTGGGLDTMIGGAGNDTYYLDFDGLKDVITDKGLPSDSDTIVMPFQIHSYTLPAEIENGTIAEGTDDSSLTGNDSNNTLKGNDGANTLIGAVGRDSLFGGVGDDVLLGGTGNDILEGGDGKDTFTFNTALTANTDKVTDFVIADDTIQLENAVFTKLTKIGVLNPDMFVKGAAHDVNDYIIYNANTGALSYDSDGSGAGAGVQIAVLGINLALTNADFAVI